MAKNNVKGASKKAQMNSLIDNMVASAGVAKGAFTFNMSIVEQIVSEFVENVKRGINAVDGHLLTGSIQELTMNVNNMNEIEILGFSHIIFQSRGVQGRDDTSNAPNSPHRYTTLKPPFSVFVEFVKQKQLITRNNSKFFADPVFDDMDTDEKINALAGALRETVYRKGFKGKGYWDDNLQLLRDELNTRVAQNLGDQIRVRIFDKYGNNVNNKK